MSVLGGHLWTPEWFFYFPVPVLVARRISLALDFVNYLSVLWLIEEAEQDPVLVVAPELLSPLELPSPFPERDWGQESGHTLQTRYRLWAIDLWEFLTSLESNLGKNLTRFLKQLNECKENTSL